MNKYYVTISMMDREIEVMADNEEEAIEIGGRKFVFDVRNGIDDIDIVAELAD